MKIRHGFVSNSSSTSFTLCFKGEKLEDLCERIKKYSKHFDLSFELDSWGGNRGELLHCDSKDVIEAIKEAWEKYKNDKWDELKILSVDEVVGVWKEHLRFFEDSKKESGCSGPHYYDDDIKEADDNISKLLKAKSKGLGNAVVIGFGDNDGHVCGTDVGQVMDYQGRHIEIDKDDLIVFTAQER